MHLIGKLVGLFGSQPTMVVQILNAFRLNRYTLALCVPIFSYCAIVGQGSTEWLILKMLQFCDIADRIPMRFVGGLFRTCRLANKCFVASLGNLVSGNFVGSVEAGLLRFL